MIRKLQIFLFFILPHVLRCPLKINLAQPLALHNFIKIVKF